MSLFGPTCQFAQGIGSSAWNPVTVSISASTLMERISKRLSGSLSSSSRSLGSEAMQGPHQVAQKSSRTIWLAYVEKFSSVPSRAPGGDVGQAAADGEGEAVQQGLLRPRPRVMGSRSRRVWKGSSSTPCAQPLGCCEGGLRGSVSRSSGLVVMSLAWRIRPRSLEVPSTAARWTGFGDSLAMRLEDRVDGRRSLPASARKSSLPKQDRPILGGRVHVSRRATAPSLHVRPASAVSSTRKTAAAIMRSLGARPPRRRWPWPRRVADSMSGCAPRSSSRRRSLSSFEASDCADFVVEFVPGIASTSR